ncbi:hypothetical protein AVEN_218793-1 [Araneus ventricosus]|uniref:Helitron helicase-like domain-containing protein n=1 Tax=Araneus ventricosus TaxID=182803 RepID=A0A4Y2B739_ARAVE|nr:hypothetical protein AVEN_218793-1 [Araneus ventricosus]
MNEQSKTSKIKKWEFWSKIDFSTCSDTLTAVRDDFNPIISAGKLTQQWIVDSYLQVEANNLHFIRTHQQHLRTELYQGLADYLENAAQNAGRNSSNPALII